MASGVPIVATRTGSIQETMLGDSIDIMWSDVYAWKSTVSVRSIIRITSNRSALQEYGGAARSKALQEFSVDGMLKTYENLFLELHSKHNAEPGEDCFA